MFCHAFSSQTSQLTSVKLLELSGLQALFNHSQLDPALKSVSQTLMSSTVSLSIYFESPREQIRIETPQNLQLQLPCEETRRMRHKVSQRQSPAGGGGMQVPSPCFLQALQKHASQSCIGYSVSLAQQPNLVLPESTL